MKVKQTDEEKKIMKLIGKNVKFYRINHNCSDDITDEYGRISQEKLAELSDTSASMIANIEADNVIQTMSIVFLKRIANSLNIPLYAFFLDKPVKNPPINPFEDK